MSGNLSILTPSCLAVLFPPSKPLSTRVAEFFLVTIRNLNTFCVYANAVRDFADWCSLHQINTLSSITPLHGAAFVEFLGRTKVSHYRQPALGRAQQALSLDRCRSLA